MKGTDFDRLLASAPVNRMSALHVAGAEGENDYVRSLYNERTAKARQLRSDAKRLREQGQLVSDATLHKKLRNKARGLEVRARDLQWQAEEALHGTGAIPVVGVGSKLDAYSTENGMFIQTVEIRRMEGSQAYVTGAKKPINLDTGFNKKRTVRFELHKGT